MESGAAITRPPIDSTPCSSNGDAAASLAAAFAAAPPFQISEPKLAREIHEMEQQGDANAWRLKFLNKVGIQQAQSSRDAASGLEDSIPLQASEDGDDEGVGSDVEMVVEKQEAPRRSSSDIRSGYIKKLEHSRAFIPQLNRPKTSQTVTIFDWDDTLLCTSHLEMVQRQYGSIPSQVREQLSSLERIVQTLLRESSKTGKVFIITNASEGWVQHSSSLCMPGLQADLAQVCKGVGPAFKAAVSVLPVPKAQA
jgi:hypothetical protein